MLKKNKHHGVFICLFILIGNKQEVWDPQSDSRELMLLKQSSTFRQIWGTCTSNNNITEEEEAAESCVCDFTEVLCCDWTGEDATAGGDSAIHDRDMDWLQQSDGDYWFLEGDLTLRCRCVWPLTFVCVFSHRGGGDAAIAGRRLRARPSRPHEEENLLSVQTVVRTLWGHFLSPSVLFLPSFFFNTTTY